MKWKATGAESTLAIGQKDLESAQSAACGNGVQVMLKRKDAMPLVLQGFREEDVGKVAELTGWQIDPVLLAAVGHNWGEAEILAQSVEFAVGGKLAFDVPTKAVKQASLMGKNEVALEFEPDEYGVREMDSMIGLSFQVPDDQDEAPGAGAGALLKAILANADIAGAAEEEVCSFDQVSLVVPRGRYAVDMHLSLLKFSSATQEIKVPYQNIVRLFLLPKANQPQTVLVMTLSPPIRRGQTFYPHVLIQFHNDDVASVQLEISDEDFQQKREKCGGKLERAYEGPTFEVFTKALRGLSSAKVTRPGSFKTASGEGHAIRCSYKSDDGYLFPLEKAFFYIQKPPILITHEDIKHIEFQRQNTGASSSRTFDLSIRTKQEDAEYQFRGIVRSEWQNLFHFFEAKQLPIANLKQAQKGPGGERAKLNLNEDVDMDDDDEGDESFDGDVDSGSQDEESDDEDFEAED